MNDFVALLASQGAALVFVATLATRLGAPVPAVPFLIVAGGLTVGGQVSFVAVVVAAMLGNILGDGVWFLAGRRWGYRVMRLLCRISLSPDSCVRRSESILGRWGGWSLIAAKFVPGVSVVAPPMAGALGMSNLRFLCLRNRRRADLDAGFPVRRPGLPCRHPGRAVGDLQHRRGALVIGVLALAAFVGWRYRQRRMAQRADDIERIEVEALREALAAGAGLTRDRRALRRGARARRRGRFPARSASRSSSCRSGSTALPMAANWSSSATAPTTPRR